MEVPTSGFMFFGWWINWFLHRNESKGKAMIITHQIQIYYNPERDNYTIYTQLLENNEVKYTVIKKVVPDLYKQYRDVFIEQSLKKMDKWQEKYTKKS